MENRNKSTAPRTTLFVGRPVVQTLAANQTRSYTKWSQSVNMHPKTKDRLRPVHGKKRKESCDLTVTQATSLQATSLQAASFTTHLPSSSALLSSGAGAACSATQRSDAQRRAAPRSDPSGAERSRPKCQRDSVRKAEEFQVERKSWNSELNGFEVEFESNCELWPFGRVMTE